MKLYAVIQQTEIVRVLAVCTTKADALNKLTYIYENPSEECEFAECTCDDDFEVVSIHNHYGWSADYLIQEIEANEWCDDELK